MKRSALCGIAAAIIFAALTPLNAAGERYEGSTEVTAQIVDSSETASESSSEGQSSDGGTSRGDSSSAKDSSSSQSKDDGGSPDTGDLLVFPVILAAGAAILYFKAGAFVNDFRTLK